MWDKGWILSQQSLTVPHVEICIAEKQLCFMVSMNFKCRLYGFALCPQTFCQIVVDKWVFLCGSFCFWAFTFVLATVTNSSMDGGFYYSQFPPLYRAPWSVCCPYYAVVYVSLCSVISLHCWCSCKMLTKEMIAHPGSSSALAHQAKAYTRPPLKGYDVAKG